MPRAVLYRHIPGAHLDEFIRQFRDAAARDPFGTVFIVPTSYLVREITHRLDEEGVPIVASAITTLQGFARKVFLDTATVETLIPDAESAYPPDIHTNAGSRCLPVSRPSMNSRRSSPSSLCGR